MLAGMALAATACVVVAVAPVLLGAPLRRVLAGLPVGAAQPRLGAVLHLPGLAGSIAPGLLTAALIVAVLVATVLGRWGSRHRPVAVVSPLWACGADRLTPRMQYTATSFAEPLQRVFDDVLRPDTDIEVTHLGESRYLHEKVAYRARLVDAVEERLYKPVIAAIITAAGWVRRAHSGSVHLYLAYGGLGVLVVLLVAR